MFNIAVLNLKDIIKYLCGIFLVIVIILTVTKILKNNNNKETLNNNVLNINLSKCIENTLNVFNFINNNEKVSKQKENIKQFEEIFKVQLSAIEVVNNEDTIMTQDLKENYENVDKQESQTKETVEETITEAKTGVTTEVVTNNPIKLNYNTEYGKVKIKNETTYDLTPEILNPNVNIENKNIVLFHTHTCESYTSSEKYQYTPTGTFRTTDLNYNVVKVGNELENHLKQYNYNVIHDISYHDYPSYNGSYTRSLQTVQGILKNTPSDIVWDVHRDAIGSRSDYAPTVKIGENEYAAQIMFVIGTNEGGLWHPNWNQNLKFAVKVQQKAEEMYPGLFKPMLVTKSRYNQHTAKYAGIIEVGATGNTLEQCLTSMKYLAKVMDEVLK